MLRLMYVIFPYSITAISLTSQSLEWVAILMTLSSTQNALDAGIETPPFLVE